MPADSNRPGVGQYRLSLRSTWANVTVRVWIQPTEETVVAASLAKGDKGCTRAKLPLLLAEYLIFFYLSTAVGNRIPAFDRI